MKVNISLSSDKYIDDIIIFEKKVRDQWSNKIRLTVFIDEVYNSKTYNLDFVFFDKKNFAKKSLDLESSIDVICRYSNILDTNLFKSDLRFDAGVLSRNQLIIKQAQLTELICSKTFDDDFISFSMGGTNIIHSILYKISESKKIFSYRIYNGGNLEKGFKQNRVWFSPNNEMLLDTNQPLFKHDLISIESKVENYLDALINGEKRETLSKQFVSRRYPNSLNSFLNEALKFLFLALIFDKRYVKYYFRLKSFINSKFIGFLYFRLNPKPYVLFPLNIPTDSQILVRAPYFRDIISLISIVSDAVPLNHNLIIREHPAFPGSLNFIELRNLLKRKKNIKLVSHKLSFFDLVKGAKSLIIINNTSYIEAILLGKPIISIGKGPFVNQNIVNEIFDFSHLNYALSNSDHITPISGLKSFISKWYLETYPIISSTNETNFTKINLVLEGILEKIDLHLKFKN
jgi:hypothetical protein